MKQVNFTEIHDRRSDLLVYLKELLTNTRKKKLVHPFPIRLSIGELREIIEVLETDTECMRPREN